MRRNGTSSSSSNHASTTRRLLSSLLLTGITFVGNAFVSTASAQEAQEEPAMEAVSSADMEEARYRFQQGALAYNSGHFEDAVQHFEAAHALSRHDEMYYNLFLAHRDNADVREAHDALGAYLRSGVSAEMAPHRGRLERTLVAMQERLTADVEPAEVPAPELPAEPMAIELESLEQLTPPPEPVVSESDESEPSGSAGLRRGVGVGFAGLALAGIVMGVVGHVKRGSEADGLDEQCQLGVSADRCPAGLDQQAIADRHSSFGVVRGIGFAIAGVGVAAALTAFLWPTKNETDTEAQVFCGASGCSIGFASTF